MTKQYISDIITKEEISKWKLGEKYLIRSGTGSGKSYWVKNVLYDYCMERNRKILFLSNRTILKNQNEEDLGNKKLEIIKTANYQYIESKIISGRKDLDYFFDPFKVIVFDEAHYFHVDSAFNRQTDVILNYLSNPPENKIIIVITATPQILLRYYDFKKENIYNLKTNYDYIEKLSFYTKERVPEMVVQNLPDNEKAIYFGDASQAWQLKNNFEDAIFICAKGNRLYREKEMKKSVAEIVEKSYFSEKLLCTTKVLDNGVNIIDSQLKTIIIDTLEPLTFIQELGRKRIINSNDKINLYVRNQHNGIVNFNYMKIRDQLNSLADFENMTPDEFIKKYRKRVYADVIDNDFEVNIAKKQNLFFLFDIYEKMKSEEDGYKKFICSILGKDYEQIKSISEDDILEKVNISSILESLVGEKLYSEEQEKFKKSFFNFIFSPKKTNYRSRAIRSINAILEEDRLPFQIISRRDAVGNKRKKRTYWMVISLNSES